MIGRNRSVRAAGGKRFSKKATQARKLRAAIPIEMLERRMLLSVSVSASTLASVEVVAGNSWTYAYTETTNSGSGSANIIETVVGPQSFNGGTFNEIDLTYANVSTGIAPTEKDYRDFDSNGDFVFYGDSTTTANGDNTVNDTNVFDPYQVSIPASLTYGETAAATINTATETITNSDGSVSTGTSNESVQTSLVSANPITIQVPAGKFGNAYEIKTVITDTDSDGTVSAVHIMDSWIVPGVGLVQSSGQNTINGDSTSFELTSYQVAGDHLEFTQQPTNAAVGAAFSPAITVSAENSSGVDANATGSITLTLNSISGTGTLVATTLTAPLQSGVATFTGVSVNGAGAYTLTASDSATPAVPSIISNQFGIGGINLNWTGNGDGVNWSDPMNWSPNAAPISGDTLIFGSNAPLDTNNDMDGLSLDDINIDAAGYDITGNAISLNGGLTLEPGTGGGTANYEIDTTLVGSPEITALQGSNLIIQSTLSGGGATLFGPGTITLEESNDYSGGTSLQPGATLNLADALDPLGTGLVEVVAPAPSTTLFAKIVDTVPFSDPMTLPPIDLDNTVLVQSGASLSVDGPVTFSGQMTLNGAFTLLEQNSTTTVTLDGPIIGNGTLTTNVAGIAVVDGDVSAGVVASSGELDLGANLMGAVGDTTPQVVLAGGILKLLGDIEGNGPIDIQGGTLMSSGAAGYGGIITVEVASSTLQLTPGTSDLGTGQLVFNSPVGTPANFPPVPTVVNTAGNATVEEIDLPITFQDNSNLNTTGSLIFGGQVNVNGTSINSLATSTLNASGNLTFSGRVLGTGVLELAEANSTTTVTISGTVADGTTIYQAGPGELDLGGTLQGALGTNNIIQQAGSSKLLSTLAGNGGLDIQSGILLASSSPSYFGTITLESTNPAATDANPTPLAPVLVKATPGNSPLGAGQIVIATPGAAGYTSPQISNASGVQQTLTLPNNIVLQDQSAPTTVLYGSLSLSGAITFSGEIDLYGTANYIWTTAATDVVTFAQLGTFGSAGPSLLGRGLNLDGPGTFNMYFTVPANLTLTAFDSSANGVGTLDLGGNLLGGAGQVTVDAGSVVVLGLTQPATLSGSGGINMMGGSITTSSAGAFNYTGPITLGTGVIASDADTADQYGFGAGTITFAGGTLQSGSNVSSGSLATPGVVNPIIVGNGNAEIDGNKNAPAFILSSLNVLNGDTLLVTGDIAVTAGLSGKGVLNLNNISDTIEITGTNPGFTGTIQGNGVVKVAQDDALGTGPVHVVGGTNRQTNVATQMTIMVDPNIPDPVLENPIEVDANCTLVLIGDLTFPAGITVDTGATLIVEGATTQVIDSGALSGGGTVIVEAGSFSTTGGTSGFTGTIQPDGGLIAPTLTVNDAGGVANGSPFPATATLSAFGFTPSSSLEGVSPTFEYYSGSLATGNETSTAPSSVGIYTVVGSFAGSTDYAPTTSAPVTFTISAPVTADKLAFSVEPKGTDAGGLATVIVKIENSSGQVAKTDDSLVTLSIGSGPGVLGGKVSVKAVNGVATFDHLLLTTAGTYTLDATDGQDTQAVSNPFTISPAAARKIVFVTEPSNAKEGQSIGTITVDVEDQYGNLETGFDSYVLLWVLRDWGWGPVFEVARVKAMNGVATFSDVSVGQPGTYQLAAVTDAFAFGISDPFTISGPAPRPGKDGSFFGF